MCFILRILGMMWWAVKVQRNDLDRGDYLADCPCGNAFVLLVVSPLGYFYPVLYVLTM